MEKKDVGGCEYIPLCKRGREGDFSGGGKPEANKIPPFPPFAKGGIHLFNVAEYKLSC